MKKAMAIELMHHTEEIATHLATLAKLAKKQPTNNDGFNDELIRSLGIAQANLLRWRMEIGVDAELIKLDCQALKD